MGIYHCKREDRFKGAAFLLISLALLFVGIYLWNVRKGCFSYSNFERITVGMTLAEVKTLLGSEGKVETEKQLPWRPGGEKVVSGETFRRWAEDSCYIIIGFKDNVVVSMWYWEPSL